VPSLGVAITTHNRRAVFLRTLVAWQRHMPTGCPLVVVDDGSDTPVPEIPGVKVIRHDKPQGVAAAKNASITALVDLGVENHFYSDDDCHPITDDWWQIYVDDPEPALCHCWGTSRLINDDGHYTTWTHPRGVMLYCHRTVIDTVGGMRLDFGPKGGGEHVEWSRRIHNAGFTTHRYQDLTAARHGIWHCEDYTRATPSTIGSQQLEATAQHRHEVYAKYRGNTDWVDYRITPDETAAAQ
jgi:glycosyltransferase involved in cell wall biosynthesis